MSREPIHQSHVRGDQVRAALAVARPFYIYILYRPDGTPFYVGKGIRTRCLHHVAEARTTRRLSHKLNIIRSIHAAGDEVRYRIESSFDEEVDALFRERELIASLGRHDLGKGPLTNQTNGGEGTSNPSEESRQRRRDSLWGDAGDQDRLLINGYFQRLTTVRSVPIKPLPFKAAAGLWCNRTAIAMSARQAGALVASAIANRVLLQKGAVVPRRMTLGETDYIIENGVGRDMLSNGTVTLAVETPTFEELCISDQGLEFILKAFDQALLIDAGVLVP